MNKRITISQFITVLVVVVFSLPLSAQQAYYVDNSGFDLANSSHTDSST